MTERRYLLITRDKCEWFDDFHEALVAWKLARDATEAALLISFGGMARSRRIAEKWARDRWMDTTY